MLPWTPAWEYLTGRFPLLMVTAVSVAQRLFCVAGRKEVIGYPASTAECQTTKEGTKDKDLNLVELPIPAENIIHGLVGVRSGFSTAAGVRYCPLDKACFLFSLWGVKYRGIHSHL